MRRGCWPRTSALTCEPPMSTARICMLAIGWHGLPISGDVYKQIGRSAAGAVSVVAAYDRTTDSVVGLTASSFVTLSFEPPLVMFAIQHSAGSYASMVSSHAFGVSLLRDSQSGVASLFATRGSEKTGKTTFVEGKTLHVPLIPEALAH